MGIPRGLREMGVVEEDWLPELAEAAVRDYCNVTNPWSDGAGDYLALFRPAMG